MSLVNLPVILQFGQWNAEDYNTEITFFCWPSAKPNFLIGWFFAQHTSDAGYILIGIYHHEDQTKMWFDTAHTRASPNVA